MITLNKNYHDKNGNTLYIINVLKKYSSEEHQLSVKNIIKYIEDIYKVKNDRRTIERNIALLKDKLDYDIIITKEGNKNYYYLLNNPDIDFEPGEIRTIIDTFSYATFIPERISKEIIKKCQNRQNIYENAKLKDYQIYSSNIKTDNMEIIKNIEDINNAIYHKKMLTFDYYKYSLNPTLESVKVASYKVSPYTIIYSIQELYLIALKEGEKSLKRFRLDRIKNLNIIDVKRNNEISTSDIKKIIDASISMYGTTGEEIIVLCANKLLDNVIEVFGKNIKITKYDNERFKLVINKDIASFKYYVLKNIEFIEIIKPETLKVEIRKIITDYLKKDGKNDNKKI